MVGVPSQIYKAAQRDENEIRRITTMATTTVSFPALFPSLHGRMPINQIKYIMATSGISISGLLITHFTAKISQRIAEGPFEDKVLEDDRLYDLQLFRNTIASHKRKIAKHKKMLASLPPVQGQN
jgi:hypothetical protein